VVLNEVFGGGGNSGAALTEAFVELGGRGSGPTAVDGRSVQSARDPGRHDELADRRGRCASTTKGFWIQDPNPRHRPGHQ
jgi:hypothetical protein